MDERRYERSRAMTAAQAALAFNLCAASAWAQAPARLPGEDGGMIQWVVAVAIAVLCGVSAFLNPKRSHRN